MLAWAKPNAPIFALQAGTHRAFPNQPYIGTALAALILGLSIPYLANLRVDRLRAQRWAINNSGNHALRLLHGAMQQERLVSVTLDNRKSYIGIVADAPNLEAHDIFFALIPFYSGYRETNDLRLKLSTNYLDLYAANPQLDPYDFRVVLPIGNVRMLGFFDQEIYPQFVVGDENQEP